MFWNDNPVLWGATDNGRLHIGDSSRPKLPITPVECERLQGFEDDFTRWGNYNGKIQPLSLRQRYNLLGNAVSVPTVQAVATRIRDNTILR